MVLSNKNNFKTPLFDPQMGTAISGLSGPGSNCNEGVLHTAQISRTGVLPPDTVLCHIKGKEGGDVPFERDS